MAAVRQIVNDAHIELGVINTGSTPAADESEYARRRLVEWLDQQSMASLLQSMRERRTHTFAASQLTYTISATEAGADMAFDLPAELDEVVYRRQTAEDFRPLTRVTVSGMVRYSSTTDRFPAQYLIEQGIPARIEFDARPEVGDFIKFIGAAWLSPDLANVTLDTELELPRGYERALKLGLALELAPSLGVQVNMGTRMNFEDAVRRIRARNIDPSRVRFDKGIVRNFARGLGRRYRRRW